MTDEIYIPAPIRGRPMVLETPPVIDRVERLLADLCDLSRETRDYIKTLTDLALAENARRDGG